MTREEWYKHTTMDRIDALMEYVQIMRDGAMETDMKSEDIEQLYRLLCSLWCDISKQMEEFEND